MNMTTYLKVMSTIIIVWALSQTVNKMYTFQLFWLETQELESQTYSQDLQEMNLTWSLNPPSEWNLQPDQYRYNTDQWLERTLTLDKHFALLCYWFVIINHVLAVSGWREDDQGPDLGHCGPGAVPRHHQRLLPRGRRRAPRLRHRQAPHLRERGAVAQGAQGPRRHQHRRHAG